MEIRESIQGATVACTLGDDDLATQAERWRALHERFGIERHKTEAGQRVHFRADVGVEDELRALVERSLTEFESGAERGVEPMHPPSRMSRARRSDLAQHYNELHGLIVRTGKDFCRTRAICAGCPLEKFLPARLATE